MQALTGRLRAEAEAIFTRHYEKILQRTDRLFAALLVAEWTAAIVTASLRYRQTWDNDFNAVHPHVWMTIALGACFALSGVAAAVLRPASVLSRHVIAAAQLLMTGLLIHSSGGRFETHFLVFGSLAFLSFYRDWRVLVTASLVTAGDHLLRGIFLPESLYGVAAVSAWRTAEHAAWVVFSDLFLAHACTQGVREMRQIAARRAQLEDTNRNIEALVMARTEELAASDERFRLFMEHSPVVACIKNDEGERVWVNDLGVRLRTEVQQWEAQLPPDAVRPLEHQIREHDDAVRAAGRAMQWEETVETEAGTRHFLTSRFPFTSAGMTFIGASAVDVTERFEYEKRLSEARDAALEATRLKSEFLANMSHEIRTPMNGVMGMTQLLLDTPLDAQQYQYAESVLLSAGHLLTIINDILDLSKIEAGKLELESVNFDLRDTLDGALQVLYPAAQKKGIAIATTIGPGTPPVVCGDPGRLRQIVMNLASNALKFTEAGEVSITAGLLETAGGAHRIEIVIRDTGIGIEQAALPRLFQMFSQADGSTTRRFGGTGLGLVITKQLVERMNGTVTVESTPGMGTTFRCIVELKEGVELSEPVRPGAFLSQGQHLARDRAATLPGSVAYPGACSLRILIADDNAINREVAAAHVRKLGHVPVLVRNGAEALAAAETQPFDVILMDCHMPVMDGFAATRELRAREAREGLPPVRVIALTASAMEADKELCRAAGMDDFVAKPFELERLRAALEAVTASGIEPENTPERARSRLHIGIGADGLHPRPYGQ